MKKIALFSGSFDPFTKGHFSIVKKASPLFDKIVIGIGENSNKTYLFSLEQRINFIKHCFKNNPQIEVGSYGNLTVDYCKEIGANYILRGLRNSADFGFERNIAQMNHAMMPSLETVFIVTDPELSAISSTIVREVIRHNGNASAFVPDGMLEI